MVGRTDSSLQTLAIILISLIAVITDLWKRKVYNWTTFPAILLGVAWLSLTLGAQGLLQSILGVGVAFLCFGAFVAVRWLGAGDLKLLMAFGAWGGADYTLDVTYSSVVFGGVLAFLTLVIHGQLFAFLKRFYRFVLSFVVRELEPESFKANRKLRLPFAIPLALAAVAEALGSSWKNWGIHFFGVSNG